MTRNRIALLVVALLVAASVGAALTLSACGGGEDEAQAQTVHFQRPTQPGRDPFTRPADVQGRKTVDVGSGPFGGTGSDLVCDRELLIRALKARPDRLREWARVLGVEPTPSAVARYIRTLKPVTLTTDTRVTNHNFVDGRAVGYQAILQAGTAVLVDKYGKIVARCRCGNPLLEPIYVPEAKCYGCPPDYHPPPACTDDDCYKPYPDPPPVHGKRKPEQPTAGGATQPSGGSGSPTAYFSPSSGTQCTDYTFTASGFRPNATLNYVLRRPSGYEERSQLTTDASGSASKGYGQDESRCRSNETGTYTATAVDQSTGASASASVSVSEASGPSEQQQTTTQEQEQQQGSSPCPEGEYYDGYTCRPQSYTNESP